MTTRPDHRNKGVENLLCVDAEQLARTMGATSVEAYPEHNSDEHCFKTWNRFSGYASHFEERGFDPVDIEGGEWAAFFSPVVLRWGD